MQCIAFECIFTPVSCCTIYLLFSAVQALILSHSLKVGRCRTHRLPCHDFLLRRLTGLSLDKLQSLRSCTDLSYNKTQLFQIKNEERCIIDTFCCMCNLHVCHLLCHAVYRE